ncbi:MAG TPA: LysM domain-containing protein, partial [Phycisphaerae bacterium]|nr:LysM domain-containing protein [Phycisphaerae bacterium]
PKEVVKSVFDGQDDPALKGSATPGVVKELIRHHVQKGETMSSISLKYYLDSKHWTVIKKANPGVDETLMQSGQVLVIPPFDPGINKTSTAGITTPGLVLLDGWKTHKVASGDLLGTIAQKYLGSQRHWEDIVKANPGINPNNLKINSVLRIPPPPKTASPTSSDGATSATLPAGWKLHKIASRETLELIAKKYYDRGSQWDVIAKANPKIDPNRLRIGTQIRIPPKPETKSTAPTTGGSIAKTGGSTARSGWKTHKIVEGETLTNISMKHYSSIKYWKIIANANPKAAEKSLVVGSTLRIPPRPAGAASSGRTVPIPTGSGSDDNEEFARPDFGP